MTTARRCSGTTKDGTRCLNRGRCPHHSGGARAPEKKRVTLDPILQPEPWPAYNPAAKSKVKDTTPRPRWQVYNTDPSWKRKRFEDMTRAEWDTYTKEAGAESKALVDAWDKGLMTFFRTLFRKKR